MTDKEPQIEFPIKGQTAAYLGLGLCSIESLLSPEQRIELERDIRALQEARTPSAEDLRTKIH